MMDRMVEFMGHSFRPSSVTWVGPIKGSATFSSFSCIVGGSKLEFTPMNLDEGWVLEDARQALIRIANGDK